MVSGTVRPNGLATYVPSGSAPPVILPESDLQLHDVIGAIRRGKGLILICAIVGVVLALLAWILTPRQYESSSVIELTTSSGEPLGLQDLSGLGAELSQGEQMNSDLLTQLTVIGSDSTILNVMRRLRLEDTKPFNGGSLFTRAELDRERGLPLEEAPLRREQALKAFKDHLKVEVLRGTRLISISYRDADPARAAAIANAIVDASIDAYTNTRYEASARATGWLSNRLTQLQQTVEQSQAKADNYQQQTGVAGLSVVSSAPDAAGSPSVTFNNLPLQRLLELNRDLTAAQVARTEKEAIFHMTETQDPATVLGIGTASIASGSVLGPGSPELALLQELRQKQASAETRLATASGKYGAKNPAVLEIQAQIGSIKEQVLSELRRIQERSLNDLQLAIHTEDGLRKQVAAQQAEVARTGDIAARVTVLQQQAQADRNLYQALHSRLEEANAVAGIRGANISVVDPARVNLTPAAPRGARNLLVGLALGLAAGLLAAFGLAYFDDALRKRRDIEALVPASVLADIPDFRTSRERRSDGWLPWRSAAAPPPALLVSESRTPAAEAYRALRTALLQGGLRPGALLFLSGSEGEGRTTTCVNTAAAFAAQGFRVLVVDADMRGPVRHGYGTPQGAPGLSSCLNGTATPAEVIYPLSGIENLSVLPAGPAVPNTVELLGQPEFRSLLTDLLASFDYVFIDSPPALTAADARVIAANVNGYLLVVRAGKTTSASVRALMDTMRFSGNLPVGVCLNATEA